VRVELEKLAEGSSFHQARGYNIGDIVSVVGKIETYKGLRQIYVSSIRRLYSFVI
jgi:DNA/RNA endonuclease YhcR with UshA esterase domain